MRRIDRIPAGAARPAALVVAMWTTGFFAGAFAPPSFGQSPDAAPPPPLASLPSLASSASGNTEVAALQPTRRLSSPTLGALSYATRVKAALLQVAQEHPEVQSAQAAADTSGFEVEAAKRARFPRLKVGTASGTYNSGADNASSQSYQLVTAEVRTSLIDGGVISARTRAAEIATDASSEAVKSTSQKVVLDAITAYLQVQRFDLKRQIAHKSTEILDELARAEQRRVALGATGQNDLQMATSRRAGIAAREADFEAQRGEALAKFQTYFKFAPNIDRLPMVAVPMQWQLRSQMEALALAEERSTEITEARSRLERARALVDQQEASVYPTLDAVLVKTKDPRGVSPSEPTRAAFELNWNFGNGFEQSLRIKSALAEVSNQESKLEGVRLNVSELTSASWSRSMSGRERERQLMTAVADSGQAFRGRRRLLEFGRTTLPVVLDAQVEYYTLLLDYVDAVYDLRISEFRLARTTGRLYVARDESNTWIDSLFIAGQRPTMTEEGLFVLPCVAGAGACSDEGGGGGPTTAAASGLALRRVQRLPGS